MKKFLLIVLSIFLVEASLYGSDTIIFDRGYNALKKGDLKSALSYFKILEDKKVTSPELFYNLGILYFESGNYAQAKLNFERAKFLDPGFTDNNFNLRAIDNYLEKSYPIELRVDTGVSGWHDWLSNFMISRLLFFTTAAFVLLLLTVFFAFFTGTWSWVIAAIVMFILWFVLLVISWEKIDYDTTLMGVTLNKTPMHMAPDNDSRISIVLPGGVKFQIVEKSVDWCLIKLSNGLTGWIAEKNIGLINPPYFYHVPTVVRRILSIPGG